MKPVIFKISLLVFFTIISCQNETDRVNKEIKPYIEFLKKENTSAKDYVLNLFEKEDIIIICERFHPEYTQYDFILDLIKDERFIKNVGNIFIEVCTRNHSKNIDYLLKSENLSKVEIDSLIRYITRSKSVHPIATNSNFPYLLNELRQINNDLAAEEKINLYPSDVSIDWKNMDSDKYKEFWNTTIRNRDKLMADYIINKFDSIQTNGPKRKKALVIMNYRHAFGNDFRGYDNRKPDNVGRYLFEKYPEKTANILLNTLTFSEVRSDNDMDVIAIQDGKWDASFKKLKMNNIGFDLIDSPFGKDYFDLWPFTDHNFTYSQVFNGFIHYTPIEKIKMVNGIENIVDSNFLQELKRRTLLVNEARGLNYSLNDSTLWNYNNKIINDKFITDSIKISIDKWLK